MSEEIDVELVVTEEDYRRVLFGQAKTRIVLSSIFVCVMILIFFSSTIFMLVSKPNLSPLLLTPLLIPVVIGAITLLQLFRHVRNQAKDILATTVPTRFVFSSDGFTTESTLSSSQTAWRSLVKIHETPLDFVFFPQKRVCYPVPKRFFQNDEQVDQMRRFISAAIDGPEIILLK